jgi:hypothetical protein
MTSSERRAGPCAPRRFPADRKSANAVTPRALRAVVYRFKLARSFRIARFCPAECELGNSLYEPAAVEYGPRSTERGDAGARVLCQLTLAESGRGERMRSSGPLHCGVTPLPFQGLHAAQQ